jgi:tRNA-specific 2-thiouridylase
MSGGVDSCAAAVLLKDQGFDVVGLTMRLPRYGAEEEPGCCAAADIRDARRVAAKLGIPFHELDFREEFRREVMDEFCRAYAEGRTPNPCVRCNERVKFGRLLEAASDLGAEALATGHYARTEEHPEAGRVALKAGRGRDDQSYFLYALSQEQLGRARFPLGELTKGEVRRLAAEHALPAYEKPDSQDLCFVPQGEYRDILRARCPRAFRPGPIVHVSGRVLGEHGGIASFTVGQRRGLGIAHGEPLYVVALRRADNAVVVGERHHVMRRRLEVSGVNWVSVPPPSAALPARVRIRYNHAGARAEVAPMDGGGAFVTFEKPQEAPCPGQAAVFYRDDVLLGGGTIEDAPPATGDESP